EAHECYEDYDSHRSPPTGSFEAIDVFDRQWGPPTTEYARHWPPWNWTLVPSSPVRMRTRPSPSRATAVATSYQRWPTGRPPERTCDRVAHPRAGSGTS